MVTLFEMCSSPAPRELDFTELVGIEHDRIARCGLGECLAKRNQARDMSVSEIVDRDGQQPPVFQRLDPQRPREGANRAITSR